MAGELLGTVSLYALLGVVTPVVLYAIADSSHGGRETVVRTDAQTDVGDRSGEPPTNPWDRDLENAPWDRGMEDVPGRRDRRELTEWPREEE